MFKSARSRLRAAVFACAAALGLGAYAATVTGYEDFGNVAGVQLWRTATDSGVTDFAFAKFAAVAADGNVGETYTQGSSSTGTHWRRWASKYNNGDNSAYYTAPGLVLVYDQAGLMATPSKGATFAPLSFGGLWVKELGANDTPYGLTDEASKSRVTEFGATGYATLFKFEKSFTINRGNASTFYGTATVNITGDAVFTASTGYATVVDAGATLKLTGDSTAAMSVGTGLTVNGTLDLTASTLPTISGNVRFAGGSSLVLPAGVATGAAISVAVCSGTLTADGVVSVKIGSADPINAALTISGGTITQIDETVVEQTFTSDYPSVVPAGYIYTFFTSAATTLSDVTVTGTLKTEGDFTITDLKVAAGGALEVVSGNTTVGGAAACQIKGNVTVDAGATLTNTLTDSLDYNGSMTVDVYGTLAMGSTRWSIPSGCKFKLHGGAQVTGVGDSLAALDIINASGSGLEVYAANGGGTVTIEGPVRVRANETRIWVASGTTLVLSRGVVQNNGHTGSFMQTGPGTLQLDAAMTLTGTSIMTQGTLRLNNTTQAFPLELQGNNSHLEIVATSAETIVPVNVTSIANNNVALTGSGKANGTITKTAAPSGDLASFLQSSAWEGTFVADWAGANGTRFDINSYGNANSTVRVTKLVGGYVSGSNANVTVVPAVEVRGFMTLDNGYSGKITTLTKLTGSGVFTNKTYSVDVTTLDNFTGTLATLIGTQYLGMQIGTINLSATPAAGAKIVNITSDSNIGNIGNTKVSVNGVVDDTIALEVKSDGIYVAVPATTVDITITEVANATVSVTTNGVAVTPVNGVVTVDIGAAVVVTYTAAEGYQLTGDAISFTASASTTTVDVSNISVAAIVANVTSADGQTTTPYTSAASAIAEADDGETVALLENTVTLAEILTISKSITIVSGNASGTKITGNGLSVYPQLAAANLTVGANVTFDSQLRVTSCDATITYPTGSTPSYRPPSGYQSRTTDNANDTSTITFYQQVYVYTAGTNATLYDDDGNQIGAIYPVAAGSTFEFTVTPAAGCALARVTADGVELTPSEGKYSISIGSSNVSIYAVAGAAVVTGGDSDEYCSSLQAAVDVATSGQTVKLLADVTLDASLAIPAGKSLTLNLNGYTLTGPSGKNYAIANSGNITLTGGTITGYGVARNVASGATITVTDGTYTATGANGFINLTDTVGCAVTINGGTFTAQEAVVATGRSKNSSITVNGGTLTSIDNAVLMDNGSSGYTGNTITVTGGTLNGGITTAGYVACGIYCANDTTVNVTGGTFNITGGCGILARAGKVSVSGTTVINTTGTATGKVGDSRIVVPCAPIVYDSAANYPGYDETTTAFAVSGGTFTANGQDVDCIVQVADEGDATPIAVSGGTFNTAVADTYCANGYEPTDDGNGTYGVREDKGWLYAAPGCWNYTGTWSEGATLGDDKVAISDGATYSNRTASAGQLVTVAMTLSFDDVNDDDSDFGDAKAAIRLAAGETDGTYQFQLYTSDGETKVWTNATVGVTATKEEDYNFVFVLDLTNKIYTASVVSGTTTNALTIGENVTEIPFACQGEVTPVQTIVFVGSGTVSSIEGSYETPEEPPAPEGFDEDDMIGEVTLTTEQATWLNDQNNYAALRTKIESMSQAAFDAAYLLNLDITGDFSYEFKVTDVEVGDAAVTVTVSLTRTGALTENENAKPIVGTMKLKGTASLGTEFTELATAAVEFDANAKFGDGATETTVTVDTTETDAKFYLPVIE